MTRIVRDVLTNASFETEEGGRIREVHTSEAAQCWIAPGFVDAQINGFGGFDYNWPNLSHAEFAASIRALWTTGVTCFLPTVITASPDDMLRSLENLAAAKRSLPEGVSIAGFHVEGPHISSEEGPVGVHPRRWARPPDLDEFRRWQQVTDHQVRMITLAPEWPRMTRYIEKIVGEGVVAAIGHTNATDWEIAEAVAAGASVSTHLGNGCHKLLPRHPNYIWTQLAEDRLMAGFIVDGVHLPPSYVKTALRAKGVERSFLVTDASPPAGASPGVYRFANHEVELTVDNKVRLAGKEQLAGSALSMDRGIENVIKFTGLPLNAAVEMATINPATAAKISGRENSVKAGKPADFVLFDFDSEQTIITVRETWINGQKVYEKRQKDTGLNT